MPKVKKRPQPIKREATHQPLVTPEEFEAVRKADLELELQQRKEQGAPLFDAGLVKVEAPKVDEANLLQPIEVPLDFMKVRYTKMPSSYPRSGNLIGFAEVEYQAITIKNIQVSKSSSGAISVSMPTYQDLRGISGDVVSLSQELKQELIDKLLPFTN